MSAFVKAVFNVRGRVQGVFYRRHCASLAAKHRVTGYAENLDDGSVEVCVVGAEEEVDDFKQSLCITSPFGGRVDQVKEISRQPAGLQEKGFEIR